MLKIRRAIGPLDAAVLAVFILAPWYFFPSGIPQPSDVGFICVVAFSSVFSIIRARKFAVEKRARVVLLLLFSFVLWVFIVTALHSVINSNSPMLLYTVFYFFNFIIFTFSFFYFKKSLTNERHWYMQVLFFTTAVSLLVSILLNFNMGSLRQTAGFNNPNQLAYFSLLLLSIVTLVTPKDKNIGMLFLFSFSVCILGVILSSSLSAIISTAFIFVAIGLKFSFWRPRNIVVSVIFTLIAIWGYLTFIGVDSVMHATDQLVARLGMFDAKTDDIVGSRGYERILEYPEYIIFGAAEGARFRFGPSYQLEIHSTLGTLLFSYGIVGLTMFVAASFLILYKQRAYVWFLYAAPMVYSLTHQGLRATFFWVLLALMLAIISINNELDNSKKISN